MLDLRLLSQINLKDNAKYIKLILFSATQTYITFKQEYISLKILT